MKKEKILGETYEKGKPKKSLDWIKKIGEREEMIKFLKNSERYWFGEGYGSERRKTPA